MIHQKLDRQGADVGSVESRSSLKKIARILPLSTHLNISGSNYSTGTAGRVLNFGEIVAGMKIKLVFGLPEKPQKPAIYIGNLPIGEFYT